ncbi:MAG: hypothetical protein ACOCXJ_00140 [Planctomycetota bacterium]
MCQRLSILITILLLPAMSPAMEIPRDAAGWSVLRPEPDSRIVYVSASAGDDTSAVVYAASDPALGADPRQPVGTVAPFASIDAAFAAVRAGAPDWVLLRAGDVWDHGKMPLPAGRAVDAPFVIADYGPGDQRPLIRNGNSGAFGTLGSRETGYTGYLVVAGIAFINNHCDPADPAYDASLDPKTSNLRTGHADVYHLLFEDCRFRFTQVNVQRLGDWRLHDIGFRRCQFLDSYSRSGHGQGLFVSKTAVDLEECLFDHGGWLQQAGDGLGTEDGVATIFNHNFYYSSCSDFRMVGNAFLRSSSMQKFRADETGLMADLLFENNLIVEGEVGLSIGGNSDEPDRFVRPVVRDNVLLDIGRTHPTDRSLAWYIGIQDWSGGLLAGNLMLHQQDAGIRNAHGISFSTSATHHVLVRDNIVHGFLQGRGLKLGAVGSDVLLLRNRVDFASPDALPIQIQGDAGTLAGYRFRDNTWMGSREDGNFVTIDRDAVILAGWQAASGETGTRTSATAHPDPERTVETYMASLGREASMDAFVAAMRANTRRTWDPAFTAAAVNDYIRAGFLADERPGRRILIGIGHPEAAQARLQPYYSERLDEAGGCAFPGLPVEGDAPIAFTGRLVPAESRPTPDGDG